MTHNSLLLLRPLRGFTALRLGSKRWRVLSNCHVASAKQPIQKKPALGRLKMWRAWHDSKRMAALGSPPAPTAWFVAQQMKFNALF
jgi:hypothetical protein